LASFDDLRRLDRRPVETGRCRVLGPVLAGVVSPPFAALQLQVELASQPEQQGTTSAAQFPTTALSVPQARAFVVGNSRQEVGRV
jgi:hypothetical protein